jgi:hypothetical protein
MMRALKTNELKKYYGKKETAKSRYCFCTVPATSLLFYTLYIIDTFA